MKDKLRRRPWVQDATGLSRSSIYAGMKDGTFPRPVRVGKRAVAWLESDIERWINNLGR